MKPQFEEKRFALRMALRLPIVVSGRSDDGAAWSEPTETDDISTLGALFQLNQKIEVGDSLYIRSHRPDDDMTVLVPCDDRRRNRGSEPAGILAQRQP